MIITMTRYYKVTDLTQILKPGKLIHKSTPNVHTGGAVVNTGLAVKNRGPIVL